MQTNENINAILSVIDKNFFDASLFINIKQVTKTIEYFLHIQLDTRGNTWVNAVECGLAIVI